MRIVRTVLIQGNAFERRCRCSRYDDTTRIQRGYNYTIRDLTGVEIEPTKTFPANAAGKSGFENSDASAVFNERLCGLLY